MEESEGRNLINFFGEFKDGVAEDEFFQQEMRKVVNNIRIIFLILGILNTLFLIPDYLIISSKNSIKLIALGRMLFLGYVLFMFYYMKHMKKFKVLYCWITFCELFSLMLFIFVFFQYDNPNYLIQAFGVMVIIIGIFMIPNRLVNMIVISAIGIVVFNVMALACIQQLEFSEFSAGIVYLIIVLVLCSIVAFKDNYYKRINFITNKKLFKMSTIDPLTKIFNRAKLNEELNSWIKYAKRYMTDLSAAIIDLDDFKSVNDNYGHLTGDKLIVDFVKIVNENIRETDIFARWGGEEFMLILPNTNKEEAFEISERIRMNVENYKFEKVNKLTCSIGVAQFSADDDNVSILQKADNMLYAAKDAGKNIVMG